jgi:methionyl aminopeptidase
VSIDSDEELEGMRRAGRVAARALDAMRASVAPGMTTAQLDDVADGVLREHGARSGPRIVYGFPGTTCISVNDEVVHGIPGGRVLNDGDIVTLDVTIELDGFFADTAATVPVGTVTPRANALIATARAAFERAAKFAFAGQPLARVGGCVEAEVRRRGFRIFPELCGHGIGRTIHEEPEVLNYRNPRLRTRLHEGLVLTIEPLVSAGGERTRVDRDGWTVRSADGALAAHHEHTLVIRSGEPEILTLAA